MNKRILIVEKEEKITELIIKFLKDRIKDRIYDLYISNSPKYTLISIINNNPDIILTSIKIDEMNGSSLYGLLNRDYKYGNALDDLKSKHSTLATIPLIKEYLISKIQTKYYANDFFEGDIEKARKLFKNFRKTPVIVMTNHEEENEFGFIPISPTGFSGKIMSKPQIYKGKISYGLYSSESRFESYLLSEINRCLN